MKHAILVALLMFCIPAFGRASFPVGVSTVDSVFEPKLTGETFTDYKQFKGNQFFTDDWMESDIRLVTGQLVHKKNIKYNGLLDQVVWLNPVNSGEYMLDKLSVDEFWYRNIMGEPVHFRRISTTDSKTGQRLDVFAETVVEGKVSIYIQRRIIKKGVENINDKDNKTYSIDVLGPKPVYYIKLPSGTYFVTGKITRHSFLKLFPDQRKAISKLLNKNHLNFRSESAVIKTIELLNRELFL
jgi:hypothetical protein